MQSPWNLLEGHSAGRYYAKVSVQSHVSRGRIPRNMALKTKQSHGVAKHGWHAINVNDASAKSFTCGLVTTFEHPELIIFGGIAEAYSVLAVMVEEPAAPLFAKAGSYDGILEVSITVRKAHRTQRKCLGYAMGSAD